MLSLRPVGDQVLVELVEDVKISTGGIHIPENASVTNRGCTRVVITELGDFPYADARGVRKWPFKVGDFALVRNGSGIDVKVAEHNCQLVKCQDVVAIVEG